MKMPVLLGLTGGGLLIAFDILFSRGPAVLLAYALLMAATGWFLRSERVQPHARRFVVGFGVFAVSTLILYGYVATRTHALTRLPVSGHVWRIAVLAVIGALFSAALTQLTSTRLASDALDH